MYLAPKKIKKFFAFLFFLLINFDIAYSNNESQYNSFNAALSTKKAIANKESLIFVLEDMKSRHLSGKDYKKLDNVTAANILIRYIDHIDPSRIFFTFFESKKWIFPDKEIISKIKIPCVAEDAKIWLDIQKSFFDGSNRVYEIVRGFKEDIANIVEDYKTFLCRKRLSNKKIFMGFAKNIKMLQENVKNDFFEYCYESLIHSGVSNSDDILMDMQILLDAYTLNIEKRVSCIYDETNSNNNLIILLNDIVCVFFQECDPYSFVWGNLNRKKVLKIDSILSAMSISPYFPDLTLLHTGNEFKLKFLDVDLKEVDLVAIENIPILPGNSFLEVSEALGGKNNSKVVVNVKSDKEEELLAYEFKRNLKEIKAGLIQSKVEKKFDAHNFKLKENMVYDEFKRVSLDSSSNSNVNCCDLKEANKKNNCLCSYSFIKTDCNTNAVVIKIPTFFWQSQSLNAASEIKRILSKARKEHGETEVLIIDLRYNPGGSLLAAIKTIEYLIGNEVNLVSTEKSMGHIIKNKQSIGWNRIYDKDIIVLVNEGSASASELFAAAVKSSGRGIIVGGARTFGKGVAQEIVLNNDKADSMLQKINKRNGFAFKCYDHFLCMKDCFYSITFSIYSVDDHVWQKVGLKSDIEFKYKTCRTPTLKRYINTIDPDSISDDFKYDFNSFWNTEDSLNAVKLMHKDRESKGQDGQCSIKHCKGNLKLDLSIKESLAIADDMMKIRNDPSCVKKYKGFRARFREILYAVRSCF